MGVAVSQNHHKKMFYKHAQHEYVNFQNSIQNQMAWKGNGADAVCCYGNYKATRMEFCSSWLSKENRRETSFLLKILDFSLLYSFPPLPVFHCEVAYFTKPLAGKMRT